MPRRDRTGPAGQGPRTGRQMGYCSGHDQPGGASDAPGRGMGGGGRGRGRGLGLGGGRFGLGRGGSIPSAPTNPREEALGREVEALRRQVEQLQSRLEKG